MLPLAGTHWLCLYHPSRQSPTWYFDSFGHSYTRWSPFLSEYLHTVNRPILESRQQVQKLNTSICGQMCLYWAYHCVRGCSWATTESIFTKDLNVNANIVEAFMSKIKRRSCKWLRPSFIEKQQCEKFTPRLQLKHF